MASSRSESSERPIEGVTQAELIKDHPLFTGKELLMTTPAEELFKAFKRAILLHETGLCFSAPSGAGKSSAVKIVTTLIEQNFPELPVFSHGKHNHQVPSIRAFFKHFLVSAGHKNLKGETFDLRVRLTDTLIERAQISGAASILLVVDEAQAMSIADFKFLKDVYNDLMKEDVQLTTILMGQEPDMGQCLLELQNDGHDDLTGRFAMRHLPFRGYRDEEDIRKIFRSIDKAEYPLGSGITWTQAFFPFLWKKGFRLELQIEPFMAALRKKIPNLGTRNVELPARQTFLAIRTFFLDNAQFKEAGAIADDAWSSAISYAKVAIATELAKSRPQQRKKATQSSES